MPQKNNRRSIGTFTTSCLLCLTGMAHGQADNTYDASANGSFTDGGNWTAGGPPWANENVDGDIEFIDVGGGIGGANITVNGIDLNYTGITGLTTDDGVNTSQLRLEGTGSLSFSNPGAAGGVITIAPTSGLTLAIDTFFDSSLTIDTTGIGNAASESVSIEELMALTSPGSTLWVYGNGRVTFEEDSRLALDGFILVGNENGGVPITGDLVILDEETIDGDVSLIIQGRSGDISRVILGDIGTLDQQFELNGLFGNGVLQTSSADVNITGGGVSYFNGTMLLDGNLSISGAGTMLQLYPIATALSPVTTATNINGTVDVGQDAFFLLGPNLISGTTTQLLTMDNLSLAMNGGYFGGNATVRLSGDFPNPNLTLNSGWLVGGDYFTGEGQLAFEGTMFGGAFGTAFNSEMGIWVTYDNDIGRSNTEAYIANTTDPVAGLFFFPDSSIHVNLADHSEWITVGTELLILENSSGFGNAFTNATGGLWNATTNLVTRTLEMSTDTGTVFGTFDQLFATIGADYASPAGGLSSIGGTMNGLIDQAMIDPTGNAGQLLNYLDLNAGSVAGYRSALSGLLPNSQFTADRVTADNMYSGVARRNIRELAIGTRGPGMIRASDVQDPILLAALQEEDALSTTNAQPDLLEPPRIIIQPSNGAKNEKDDDVFQALFGEGYGRWNDMDSVGFVPGYSARSVGVAGGWGVGLAEGITVGITAGWENTTATLNGNLGDVTVDSFRGSPFVSWSDSDGEIERYAMFSVGGGYNTSNGDQDQKAGALSSAYNFDMTGWEVDIEAAVGTRVPMTQSFALQPEASIRYSILNYSGTNTDKTTNIESDYKGDDFQFVTGRFGFGMEWLLDPFSRFTASLGWQGQYLEYGSATFTLPGGLGMASQDGGDGTVNQFYVGTQLLFNPNWNTAISVGYEGAFGDGSSNAFTGSLILRF